mmetsp:Transcript_10872/g.24683  ORF Transcript_10872/g.24683 Transcript_10872/m.24683 type:complete len:341 (+) Transcript_10872:81-1103(+)
MGSGVSNFNSLSGGNTLVTGTFLAERTGHGHLAAGGHRYNIVSAPSVVGGLASTPRSPGTPGSVTSGKAKMQGGGAHLPTYPLPALSSIEPLLDKTEDEQFPRYKQMVRKDTLALGMDASQEGWNKSWASTGMTGVTPSFDPQASTTRTLTVEHRRAVSSSLPSPRKHIGSACTGSVAFASSRGLSEEATAVLENSIDATKRGTSASPSMVASRLYQPRRPSVAMKSNSELLAWIAKRANDPRIATPPSSQSSRPASTPNPRRKDRSPSELFSHSLHRGHAVGKKQHLQLRGCGSSGRHRGGHERVAMLDLLQEIKVSPENMTETFLSELSAHCNEEHPP